MKYVLILLFPLVLSSCACKPVTEYVQVYPVVPQYSPIAYPDVELKVWSDYSIYKAQCEYQIQTCNSNIESVYKALELDNVK